MNRSTNRAWQSALLSFSLPGLGQLSNGEQGRGLMIFTILIVGNALLAWLMTAVPEEFRWLIFGMLLLGNLTVYLYAIGQAYRSKERINSHPWYILLMFWMLGTGLIIGAVLIERSYWIHAFKVPSISMEPTISEGDYLITTKRMDQVHPVAQNDVVIFLPPHDPSIYYIKRIVALSGDDVRSDGQILTVNGQAKGKYHGEKFHISVPQGELFVIGDNRENTSSSVDFGTVPIRNVVGKPILRWISPKGEVGTIKF